MCARRRGERRPDPDLAPERRRRRGWWYSSSSPPSIFADGRYVAFTSEADNLMEDKVRAIDAEGVAGATPALRSLRIAKPAKA